LSSIRHALSYRDVIMEKRHQTASNPNDLNSPIIIHDDDPYHIVLVNGDDYLLRLISGGLIDENGRESLYSAIQREIKQESSSKKFNSVVECFHTAKAGLAYVEKNPCELIIAAQVLPDMDGIQFLTQMRQVIPDAARILISDAPDKLMLTQAINKAEVQGLLQLQFVNYELRADARRQSWNLHQIKTVAIQALVFRELLLGNTRTAS
jgi:CheY-like chemotaxis protein